MFFSTFGFYKVNANKQLADLQQQQLSMSLTGPQCDMRSLIKCILVKWFGMVCAAHIVA